MWRCPLRAAGVCGEHNNWTDGMNHILPASTDSVKVNPTNIQLAHETDTDLSNKIRFVISSDKHHWQWFDAPVKGIVYRKSILSIKHTNHPRGLDRCFCNVCSTAHCHQSSSMSGNVWGKMQEGELFEKLLFGRQTTYFAFFVCVCAEALFLPDIEAGGRNTNLFKSSIFLVPPQRYKMTI